MGQNLTTRCQDYSKWYNELVVRADLAENSAVRGCMIIKPYGYAIWERCKLNSIKCSKILGIPMHTSHCLFQSLFEAEEKNAEGFAKECAVVTHYRLDNDPDRIGKLRVDPKAKLEEELIVRPTSEAIIWSTYKIGYSHRDLPPLMNQWVNVVRWEMNRLFLRTSEFLWQEGHTAHATKEEAIEETIQMNEIYAKFVEDLRGFQSYRELRQKLSVLLVQWKPTVSKHLCKTERRCRRHCSLLGQNFAKAFDVKFTTKKETDTYGQLLGRINALNGGFNHDS